MDKHVAYWPTGWKDLTGLRKLPVVTEEKVSITPPPLPSTAVASRSDSLPSVDGSNIISKRSQLKRQGRVTHDLGAHLSALPVLNTGPSYLTARTQSAQEMDVNESCESNIPVSNRKHHSKQTEKIAVPFTAFRIKSPLDKRRLKHIRNLSEISSMDVSYYATGVADSALLGIPMIQQNKTPPPNNDIKFHFMPLPKIAEERVTVEPEFGLSGSLSIQRPHTTNSNTGVFMEPELGLYDSLNINKGNARIPVAMEPGVVLNNLISTHTGRVTKVTRHVYLPRYLSAKEEKDQAADEDKGSKKITNSKPGSQSDIPETEHRAVSVIELVPFKDIEKQDINGKMDVDTDGYNSQQSRVHSAADVIRFSNSVKVKLNKRFEAIRAKSRTRSLLASALPPFGTKLEITNTRDVSDNSKEFVSISRSSQPVKKGGISYKLPSVEKKGSAELPPTLAQHEGSSKRNHDRNVILKSNNQSQPNLISDTTFTVSKRESKEKTYLVLKDRTSSLEDRTNNLKVTYNENEKETKKDKEYDCCPRAARSDRTPKTHSRNSTKVAVVPTKRTDYVFPSALVDEPGTKKVRSKHKSYIEDWSTEVLMIKDKSGKHQQFIGTRREKSFHASKLPSLGVPVPSQPHASVSKPIDTFNIASTEMKSKYVATEKDRTNNIEKVTLVPGKRNHRKKRLSKMNKKDDPFNLKESENTKTNVQCHSRNTGTKSRNTDPKSRNVGTKSARNRRTPDYISPNGSFQENTLVMQYGSANGSFCDMQPGEDDFQGIPREEQNLLYELSNIHHKDYFNTLQHPALITESSVDSMLVDDTPLQNTVTLRDVLSSIADDKPITEYVRGFNSQPEFQNIDNSEQQTIGSGERRHGTMEVNDLVDEDRRHSTLSFTNRAAGTSNSTTEIVTGQKNEDGVDGHHEDMEIDSTYDMKSLHINKTNVPDNNVSVLSKQEVTVIEPVIEKTLQDVCQTQIVKKEGMQIYFNDNELNSTANTTQTVDTNLMQLDVNDELKSVSNITQETDKHLMQVDFTDSQLPSAKSMNPDIDVLMLSVNSTTKLSPATLQIIQDTVVKYGADSVLSESMSNNIDQDGIAIDAVASSQVDGVSNKNETVDAEVEQNADNDEDYMDSNILANNYVPGLSVPPNPQSTSSKSLADCFLDDEEENHVKFSDIIQVAACKIRPEVKISRPKPSPAPPIKRHPAQPRKTRQMAM